MGSLEGFAKLQAVAALGPKLDQKRALADVNAALRALTGDAQLAFTKLEVIEPDVDATTLNARIATADKATVLVLRPGRYALRETIAIKGKSDVALVGGPDVEIFVTSGNAVVAATDSSRVLLAGLYMNHWSPDVETWSAIGSICESTVFAPKVKGSDVVLLERVQGAMILDSELEGSGFIGLHARGSRDLRLVRALLHDCIAEGIRLESSALKAEDVAIYAVGSREFFAVSQGDWCHGSNDRVCVASGTCFDQQRCTYGDMAEAFSAAEVYFSPPTFRTAVTVDKGSTLDMKQATIVVTAPLAKSQAFEVAGGLVLDGALVEQPKGSIAIPDGASPSISVKRSCFSAPAPGAVKADADALFGTAIAFKPARSGDAFDTAPVEGGVCEGRGARLAKSGIKRRDKPGYGPNGDAGPR